MNIKKWRAACGRQERGDGKAQKKEEENAAFMCNQVCLTLRLGHKVDYAFFLSALKRKMTCKSICKLLY